MQYLRTALGSLAVRVPDLHLVCNSKTPLIELTCDTRLSNVCVQVACPSLSVSASTFTTAAAAAVTNYGATLSSGTSSTAFNPYGVLGHFWLAAFIFEDVGVTAYKGAVSVLAVSKLLGHMLTPPVLCSDENCGCRMPL